MTHQPDDCESEFSAGHPAAPHDDDHGSGHGHSHDHGLSGQAAGGTTGTAKHRKRLILALCITLTVVVVQFVGALISGSLSLLADTGHMLTDATGIAIATVAVNRFAASSWERVIGSPAPVRAKRS